MNKDLLDYKFACMSAALMIISGYGIYVVEDQINIMETVSFTIFFSILIFSTIFFIFFMFRILRLLR